MPDYRTQQRPRLLWDPEINGWVDPRDPYYHTNPLTPSTLHSYPPRYEESTRRIEVEPKTEPQGPLLRAVATEEEAWKIVPDRFTGDWQYFIIGEGESLTFAIQYYDADIPGTVREVFKRSRQETVEPTKSPVEVQLLNLQEQLLEIKEMLTNAQNPPTDMETTSGGPRQRGPRSKPAGDTGSSDGSG